MLKKFALSSFVLTLCLLSITARSGSEIQPTSSKAGCSGPDAEPALVNSDYCKTPDLPPPTQIQPSTSASSPPSTDPTKEGCNEPGLQNSAYCQGTPAGPSTQSFCENGVDFATGKPSAKCQQEQQQDAQHNAGPESSTSTGKHQEFVIDQTFRVHDKGAYSIKNLNAYCSYRDNTGKKGWFNLPYVATGHQGSDFNAGGSRTVRVYKIIPQGGSLLGCSVKIDVTSGRDPVQKFTLNDLKSSKEHCIRVGGVVTSPHVSSMTNDLNGC